MGSGKTSVGRSLAEKLGMNFIDIDIEIEKSEQMSIKDIFDKKGESYFRDVESVIIRKFCELENTILAAGGGSTLNTVSHEALKNSGPIIYLKTSLDVIKLRVNNENKRPLLKNLEKFERLYDERLQVYGQADIMVDTNNLSIDQVADEICGELKKFNSRRTGF
jgi:shikimate kinase